ncbi:TPA: hypothetical protein ACK3Q6_006452 [Burkholderia cepacia]|uniref:Uncharacterized protein n=4 Tax=Burkholderia TaxID=32008 RepID=A0A250LL38_9BURK|nr:MULTISPECIES: hypothetical protein [Burkholderia cepacia complex]MBX3843231.1 hypothetical protein [Burkholderia contaminans]MBX3861134.1 hypothetical protein [Burkholderia contaminans]MBX3868815.1 hypothetical protein [Burkholderia contaminans]MBX3929811.1 hypothetical protein [Burkholderia contaminans]MBY4661245.1 hypothetical protein [Burkholderia contaminans]
MDSIELRRRFHIWDKDSTAELVRWWPWYVDGLLAWSDILRRRRVVILAEAGSGKSVELERQADLLTRQGKLAFRATLQEVAQAGLDDALGIANSARLQQWRECDDPAWFFIDSIDEAKLEKIRLDNALRKIADGILGHEDRAFIVLSGRHTEWEYERDTDRLANALPIPEAEVQQPELRTLIRRLLDHEKRPPAPEKEVPLIVLMAPLDDEQMHLYATSKGVEDVEVFLTALRNANVLEIARRPLDLDWLVRYWRTHGRLGSFADMVAESLRERLQETDPDRRRHDSLNAEHAFQGLERVGAALVFGRKQTIAIPDSGAIDARAEDTLTIDAVLQDWSSRERVALLSRAVFDPAAFGRARLHNDNEGVVRSYLAAQWLLRLRRTNLSGRQLQDLLFAQTYGLDLIRPSMQETAAWLSIWDNDVAREVVRRDPALMFAAGDPASLSSSTRGKALWALAAQYLAGQEVPLLRTSNLTRFAQPDIAQTLHELWQLHSAHVEVRKLVLTLISLGALSECADIASSAAYGSFSDQGTLYLAGQALLAAGDDSQRRAYAEHIKCRAEAVPIEVLASAIEALFPDFISIDDLVGMFASGALQVDDDSGHSLKWSCASLAARITSPRDLDRLIRGLLNLDACTAPRDGMQPGEGCDTLNLLLAAAADRRLAMSGPDEAPDAAIDVVLLFSEPLGMPRSRNDKLDEAVRRLHESTERRRAAFWRAAQTLSASRTLQGRRPENLHEMAYAGWRSGLRPDDLEWLMADGPSRESPSERRLAASAAMDLWAGQGRPDAILARIEGAATACPEMRAVVDEWLSPPAYSPELEESMRRLEEAKAESERQRAEREDSWVNFVEALRNDPEPLGKLLPPAPGQVSQALFDLWQLLREANRERNRYVISSVAPLAELAGDKVACAFAEAARRVWRERRPDLRSARTLGHRNMIGQLDLLGIAAVSIEAAKDPSWANHLSAEEAVRAAEYATIEINELPPWIESLANAWPTPVRDVLMTEVLSEIDTPGETHRPTLDYIDRGPESVARVIAGPVWGEVESRDDLGPAQLRPLLSIALRGLNAEMLPRAYALSIERFGAVVDSSTAAQYLGFACAIDAPGATQALVDKLATLDEDGKTALVEPVLPQIFGSRFSLTPGRAVELDMPTLLRLVILAYRTVRMEEDNDRVNGGVYSPNLRDNAEEARSGAFKRLVETPGRPTYDALRQLETEPGFPVRKARLEMLERDRAALDSEMSAWAGGDALLFERRWERVPATGRELQMLALQRLEDLQHDLLHADFAQGSTLSALPDEAAVQAWLADRMRLTQGWSYSVEREPETVDAKKPDIVLTARATAAKVPVEIKVAETWTLTQLEAALETQLCGQYLRARDCREGLLVLVHQTPRPVGWKLLDRRHLSFAEVVERLKDHAQRLRQASASGPYPQVAVIDVSSCARQAQHERVRRKPRGQKNSEKISSRQTSKRGTSPEPEARRSRVKN